MVIKPRMPPPSRARSFFGPVPVIFAVNDIVHSPECAEIRYS